MPRQEENMKVITTNRLNRFWKNGILPIKNSLANKLNTSSVVNNLLTTAAGYALDARQGKALDDKITALNGKYTVDVVWLGLGDIVGYGVKTGSVSCAKSGYTPIGIVGYATIATTGESAKINIANLYITNNLVDCAVFNISSTTVTNYYVHARVLYSKNL